MIYENKDIAFMISTIEDLLFEIGILKTDFERKDLSNKNYNELKQIATDLETAYKLIEKHDPLPSCMQ